MRTQDEYLTSLATIPGLVWQGKRLQRIFVYVNLLNAQPVHPLVMPCLSGIPGIHVKSGIGGSLWRSAVV